jgi:hypothetical protein
MIASCPLPMMLGQTRQQPKQSKRQKHDEQQKHRNDRRNSRHAAFLQRQHHAVEQVSQYQRGEHRCQHLPHGQHDHKTDDQQQRQDHRLRIGEKPLVPPANQLHQS